jgi:hypothetical protein
MIHDQPGAGARRCTFVLTCKGGGIYFGPVGGLTLMVSCQPGEPTTELDQLTLNSGTTEFQSTFDLRGDDR